MCEGGEGGHMLNLTISATLLQNSGRCIEKWYRSAQHVTAHSVSSPDRPQSITSIVHTIKFITGGFCPVKCMRSQVWLGRVSTFLRRALAAKTHKKGETCGVQHIPVNRDVQAALVIASKRQSWQSIQGHIPAIEQHKGHWQTVGSRSND